MSASRQITVSRASRRRRAVDDDWATELDPRPSAVRDEWSWRDASVPGRAPSGSRT